MKGKLTVYAGFHIVASLQSEDIPLSKIIENAAAYINKHDTKGVEAIVFEYEVTEPSQKHYIAVNITEKVISHARLLEEKV